MRARISTTGLSLLALAALGCGPSAAPLDASSDTACPLSIEVGHGGASFVPYANGDSAELVLGFQGFLMLPLDVRVQGAIGTPDTMSISATVTIADTGADGGRTDRAVPVVVRGAALAADGWLLFFNTAPEARIAGHDGLLELIVHAGPCAGGVRVTLHLVDENRCVVFDASVPEVGTVDGGVPDGSVACGAL